MASAVSYPVDLSIDYPDRDLDRFSSFFRIIFVIPIFVVLGLLGAGGWGYDGSLWFGPGTTGGVLFGSTLLMIVFRQKYPRWWFDFNYEILKLQYRVQAYLLLLSDEYPSTDEEQYAHLTISYPDVPNDLNRWLPLVKWLLAIPHYIVLFFLFIALFVAAIVVWFAILFTGRYPRGMFDFVVGVQRWGLRVECYAVVLVTDEYPPFRLAP